MQIPPWLIALTQAGNGMSPSNLDNFVSGGGYKPTMGDAARSVGHDMMEHFRAGQAKPPLATPAAGTAPGMTPAPAPMAIPIPPNLGPPGGAAPAFPQGGGPAQPLDLSSILSGIGHGIAPHIPAGVPLSKVAIHFATPQAGS